MRIKVLAHILKDGTIRNNKTEGVSILKRIYYKTGYITFFLCYVNILYSQYIYTAQRDTSDIYHCVKSLYRTNIFTCEREELLNFYKLGYNGIYKIDVDKINNVLFFSYNLMSDYAMIDLSNTLKIVDLTRDVGDMGWPETGIDYQTAYHRTSGTLYLYWRKYDPEFNNQTGEIDSCAIVDPETGKNIESFEPFFDIYSASFREDGNRLYATKILPIEERCVGKIIQLVINAKTGEVIESIMPQEIEPEADIVFFFNINGRYRSTGNIILTGAIHGEGENEKRYMFAYNMDTKRKSRRIFYDVGGHFRLSPDASKIIIDEYDPNRNQFKGVIHILNVEWPENDDATPMLEEGITVLVPPPERFRENFSESHSVIMFPANPDVIIYQYQNEPMKNTYLIRLSDGMILREGK